MPRPETPPALRALKRAQGQVERAETRLRTLRYQRNALVAKANAEGASYRRIAAELGWQMASVQHYMGQAALQAAHTPDAPAPGDV